MRTALVTGGTTRIGKEISDHLRGLGWRVLTTSHRGDSGADIIVDLADPAGPARCFGAALQLLGGVPPDALVNNAALFSGDDSTLDAVNFEAPRKLTILMSGRESGVGAVVNILDDRVLAGESAEGADAYRRTKSALLKYTRTSAALFVDTLRVNAVAPGPVMVPTEVREKAGETPLGRPTAAKVAEAVAYLLDATFTSGTVIPVDGGQHLMTGA